MWLQAGLAWGASQGLHCWACPSFMQSQQLSTWGGGLQPTLHRGPGGGKHGVRASVDGSGATEGPRGTTGAHGPSLTADPRDRGNHERRGPGSPQPGTQHLDFSPEGSPSDLDTPALLCPPFLLGGCGEAGRPGGEGWWSPTPHTFSRLVSSESIESGFFHSIEMSPSSTDQTQTSRRPASALWASLPPLNPRGQAPGAHDSSLSRSWSSSS